MINEINSDACAVGALHYPIWPFVKQQEFTYVEEPIWILERGEQKLKNKTIPYVKVCWKHNKIVEGTWGHEWEI